MSILSFLPTACLRSQGGGGRQKGTVLQAIMGYNELPEKFQMIPVYGKDNQERWTRAQEIAAEHDQQQCYYIERKDYKASCAYVFIPLVGEK